MKSPRRRALAPNRQHHRVGVGSYGSDTSGGPACWGLLGYEEFAAKIRQSLTSPIERLRAHERRKMDKIAELEQRIARFEAVLGERFAELGEERVRKRITALEAALQKCPGEACLLRRTDLAPQEGERAHRVGTRQLATRNLGVRGLRQRGLASPQLPGLSIGI